MSRLPCLLLNRKILGEGWVNIDCFPDCTYNGWTPWLRRSVFSGTVQLLRVKSDTTPKDHTKQHILVKDYRRRFLRWKTETWLRSNSVRTEHIHNGGTRILRNQQYRFESWVNKLSCMLQQNKRSRAKMISCQKQKTLRFGGRIKQLVSEPTPVDTTCRTKWSNSNAYNIISQLLASIVDAYNASQADTVSNAKSQFRRAW